MSDSALYSIVFYVPESHCEIVKTALFKAGAGQYSGYDRCSWQTSGTGQFRAKSTATPFLGTQGKLETITEYRVEMICEDKYLKAAIQALKNAHPYEVPAYSVIQIVNC